MSNQTIFDNFLKSYEDKTYKHPTLIRHKGTVIAFAMDNERRIYYTVLDLSDSDENKGPIDVEYWSKNPSPLHFANEIGQVGYGLVGATRMPTVKKGTLTEDKPENLNLDEIDEFLSTTARLTADAPFQVLSDDQYIYLFRQSIAGNDPNIVYKLTRLQGGGSSGDTTRDNSEFVLSGGNKVPLVNNTLLLDRFVLAGSQLQPKMEVRYKRSRNKTQPANSKDSLGAKDIEGKAFYEPTQELDFVQQLQGGRFQVLLLPTQVANIQRWQVFTYNSATSKIDSFNIERAGDGLFNTKGTIYYTSPDAEYQNAIFQRRPGVDSFTNEELVPILNTKGAAESALSFDGTDNYVDLGNPSELKITGSQTIEMWVKPLSLANRQSLFCKAYNGEGAITLEVDGKLSYYYGTGGDNPSEANINYDTFEGILSTFGLLRDEWSHIAIVRNFESRRLTWYIDGAFAGEEIITKDAATAGNENIFLGKGYADNFNGCIDEVRIWNRARTGYEINEDRHHRLVGRETGLVGYWRFDENTGATVYDQTDYANNGTINGASWEESDALIGNHPGMSRDSFSFQGRTIESGLTVVQYFQQEDAQIGDEESKPMKTNARVMLAVATGGTDANGATTTNKYIATLDFAVSREGRLAQIPDNLSLNWLNRTDIDGDSIENYFAEVGNLEEEISQLKRDIQIPEQITQLQEEIDSIYSTINSAQDTIDYYQQIIDAPIADMVSRYDAERIVNEANAAITRMNSEIDELNNQLNQWQTEYNWDDSTTLTEKQATLISKQQELESKKEQLHGQVSLPMALLHTDSDGLTTSGALLGFAYTGETPQLFDSAMGKLALYFQGTNTQFFTAYYDTKTARAQKVIDLGGKKVRFIARSVGAESNAATITISDGNSDDTCEVTIANSQTEITETWKDVPRDPRMFSKVLNGQAKPLYLGQVAATSGTVTELTLVETTNRQLAAGAVLKIGETKVTTSAEVQVNSSTIPVNTVSLEVEEDTPVYLVLYDYPSNDSSSFTSAALDFNGSSDYIEIGHFNPGNTFTIELWIKYKTGGIHCFIGKNDNSGNENLFLFGYWNNEYRIIMPSYSLNIPSQITVGEWLHVAAVIKENQGNSEIKFYQDGLFISEHTLGTTLGNIEGKPWSLGQEWDGSTKSDFFNGQMDEVRIWNYARTGTEINADKDRRITGKEPGLVGYWHFDGLTAKDYSGNGNDGTIYGNPQNVESPPALINNTSVTTSVTYSAMSFNGSSDYVNFGDKDIGGVFAQGSSEFTISGWVKPHTLNSTASNHGTRNVFLARASDSYNDNFELGISETGNLDVYIDENYDDITKTFGNGELTPGNWHFFSLVFNRGSITTYLNENKHLGSFSGTSLDEAPGSPVTLGATIHSDVYFNGQIDELRIWNYARSEEQIYADKNRRLTGNEPGLVGYWNFEGGLAKDYSGNGNDGTIHGNPQNFESPPGLIKDTSVTYSSLSFNGSSDYVNFGNKDIGGVFAQGSSEFTISGWVKPHTLNATASNHGTRNVLLARASDDHNDNFELGISQTGNLDVYIDENDDDITKTFGNGELTPGNWHFFSLVFNMGSITIYLDENKHLGSFKGTALDLTSGSPVTLGATLNSDVYFNGQIDELRIWNYARSEEQINADKDRRLTGNEVGLVGYWHFEGGVANDYSGNGNDGSIHGNPQNMPSPPALIKASDVQQEETQEEKQQNSSRQFLVYSEATEGQIPNGTVTSLGEAPSCRWVADSPGLALDFDGQNKYLALADNKLPQMDAIANLTIEAWVKPKLIGDVGRVIHHKSANSQYTLGLQRQPLTAFEFNGSTDYVEIGHFNPGNTFTIELWVKSETTSSGCLVGKNSNNANNLFLLGYFSWNFSGNLSLQIHGYNLEITDDPSTLGKWFHLAVVIKENQGNSEINVYQDGVLISEVLANNVQLGNIEGLPWSLGQEWDPTGTSDFFNGQMDEVRIWNYARSKEQIQANKDRRLSGNESGLVGYWHFEGGTAQDYSGNGNDGTIHGNPTNVASPLTGYKVFGGVGVSDNLAQANRFFKTKEFLPLNNWNHLALSYHQSYALNFDGNDYLDCGKNRALNLCEDLTIETVIQVNDTNLRSIISKGQMGYGVEKESVPYALQAESGKLTFSFEDSQGTIHKLESPANKIQTNQVHKIAVTRKKITQTTDSGADPDAWGTGDVANIDAKTGNFTSSENQKIDKAMKADYVASKKRGKNLKDGLQSQSSSTPSQQPTFISGQGTAQWLELKMYIDEKLVCSRVIEPAVSPEGNSQPLEIGRTGESYFKGKISEVKLWSRALEKGEIHQNLTGQEEGLVAWWQLEENEGNLANDFKGGNHAQIKGAKWCKNPDVEASELLLYSNGVPLTTESVASNDSLVTWGDNQFTLGGRKDGASYQECFNGILEEVRIWKVVRTQEQILDNIFTRLKGEKQDIIANYTFDEIIDNEFKDSSLMGNHLPLGADANKPTSVFSDAPIGNDIPQVRSALAAIQTVFNAQIDSSPAVTEYGDMQYDSQQNLTGVFKRCYTYIKDGKWQLITGYKVGNLITEWVSQVQFDPQIIGYIEGAPPIPSENMTVGPISLGDTDTYKQASTVELIEAEDVNYNFSSSKENGFDSSFEAAMSAGMELDLRTLLAPLGFGVSFKAQVELKFSGSGKFQSSGGWTDESRITSGRTVTRNMRATAVGYWEDKNNLLNPRLGQRYVPNNQGFALVQSETADVFALRLAHNKALISYRFQPNPDIPKDWNIISFPINPRYTKQGTLDGKVGYQPDGSVQTDPDYPQATQYGEYSYFKPLETYALKRQIEREAAELKNYYQNYDASPLSNSILKNVMGTNAGLLASGAAAIPNFGIGIGLSAASTFGSLADALTTDQSLPDKFANRNIANTYVWTADGGFYAETTNTMDVRQESSSGSYSFNTTFGSGISLNVSTGASFGFDLNGSMGGHMNMTQSKSVETSQSFRLEVQVNPQNNLYKYEVPEDQKDWESTYVDYLLQYDTQGNPIKVPGKVDAYRFMTFYLEPKAENFEDFYAKVVDPIWIEQSNDPNAQALREARQTEKKPACWRIMHRVTFVSRLLQDFNDDSASQLAKDARALNIESNWQLIKTLEPFVKNKTDNFVQFAEAVRDALAEHLPELQPHSPEIIAYITQYYGLSEDA
ncbi:MAG: hypothetical protein F6K23_29315 [Okeania sp. SIO2C9]|uniref:LamG-like jellyroll fold domain-containing protein n=1 Tax=Okeania sp. SIO2C9 TaxID=2607791 RepID=UPI0013BF4413|nr:LamG-like jellyroll fold domain-containing protein [Okeania sp. SIO2C9]NEQ76762.1 hypothetical protein [Okeania sp. SIO2C9]